MYRIKTGEYSYIGDEDWAVEYFFSDMCQMFQENLGLKNGCKIDDKIIIFLNNLAKSLGLDLTITRE